MSAGGRSRAFRASLRIGAIRWLAVGLGAVVAGAAFADGIAQEVLDLGVEAAQLVPGPAVELIEEVRRQADEE